MFTTEIQEVLTAALRRQGEWRLMFRTLVPELPELNAAALCEHLGQVRRDRHPNREIFMVLSGSGNYYFQGRLYRGSGLELFFVDCFEPHDFGFAPSPEERLVIWVCYDIKGTCSAAVQRVLPSGRLQVLHILDVADVGMAMLLYKCWEQSLEGRLPAELSRIRLGSYFGVLLAEILTQEIGEIQTGQNKRATEQSYRIETIGRHLQMTKGRGDSIRKLAQMVNYSEFHFMKLFRVHYQCSVKEYINRIRLQTMLESERAGFKQKEIADILGFSSPSSFAAWLAKQRDKVVRDHRSNEPAIFHSVNSPE